MKVFKVTREDGTIDYISGIDKGLALLSHQYYTEDDIQVEESTHAARKAFMEGITTLALHLKQKHEQGHTITGDSLDVVLHYTDNI